MANLILDNEEKLIGLAEVAKAHNVHPATVTRWIQQGARGADGTRLRLEGVRRGYKWLSSKEALVRFFERLSEIAPASRSEPSPVERLREVEAAHREMELAGA